VLTTAAAYMLLGVQYQFSTQFFVTRDAGGNLQELCIRVRRDRLCVACARLLTLRATQTGGDPSLTQQTLQKALAALQLRGPLPMLVVDNTHYTPSEPYPLNWEAGDLAEDYGAQPTAPILDENTVGVVVTPTQPGQVRGAPRGGLYACPRAAAHSMLSLSISLSLSRARARVCARSRRHSRSSGCRPTTRPSRW
jgi:D-alanyl-D-alanine carboxypeptidase